jgi:hypothetical protein
MTSIPEAFLRDGTGHGCFMILLRRLEFLIDNLLAAVLPAKRVNEVEVAPLQMKNKTYPCAG